jgi:type IV pilus assembly protein PilN
MAKINLLPWRDTLRAKQKKNFLEACGLAAILGAMIAVMLYISVGIEIDSQIMRNDKIKAEIAKLDGQIEEVKSLEKRRNLLVERMKIIGGLQSNRPQVVHLFDELVKTLPDGVYFTSVNRSAGRLHIDGLAESNAGVSALMRKLDASPWLKDPLLTDVTTKESTAGDKNNKVKVKSSAFNLDVFEESAPAPTPAASQAGKGGAK